MDKTELVIWAIAGLLFLIWFVLLWFDQGAWIHALLIAALLLGVFDLLSQKQQSAERKAAR